MTEHPTTDAATGGVPGPLSVVVDGQTYRNLAYLLVRFGLGIAYFTAFVTGLALGVALVPLGVGVVVLAGVLAMAEHAGLVEAYLLERLLGRRVEFRRTDPTAVPAWPYLKTVATTERNYWLVGYCLLSFFLGILAFVAVVTGLSLSLALAVAPLAFWVPGTRYDLSGVDVAGGSLGRIDTVPEALVASVVGVGLGLGCLYAFNAAASALGSVTVRVLGAD
jgi:hypothetical protein